MFALYAPSLIPPVDATQEFRVATNNYPAEFGRSSGAVVNIGIKSGTKRCTALVRVCSQRQVGRQRFFRIAPVKTGRN